MYCDIKHIVNVTDVDGTKLEDSVTKHEKIFLGEVRHVSCRCDACKTKYALFNCLRYYDLFACH